MSMLVLFWPQPAVLGQEVMNSQCQGKKGILFIYSCILFFIFVIGVCVSGWREGQQTLGEV